MISAAGLEGAAVHGDDRAAARAFSPNEWSPRAAPSDSRLGEDERYAIVNHHPRESENLCVQGLAEEKPSSFARRLATER